jgi:cyclopropane fatty-acyl-phospholipid synthase-like methyltransferase
MPDPPPYRDLYYPLNVFMHILTLEEGEVRHLHYGLFEREGESIGEAQEHSTALLLEHLPPPPARILDVGSGLGTTVARLTTHGYDAEGITADAQQAAFAHNPRIRVARFEDFVSDKPYDALVFQESSQYIDSETLFARARDLTTRVIILDEFGTGTLHRLDAFLEAASAHGFRVTEEIDVSAKAIPTIDYFRAKLPSYRERLIADLGITSQQVDDLIRSGEQYRANYANGTYIYRLLRLERQARQNR